MTPDSNRESGPPAQPDGKLMILNVQSSAMKRTKSAARNGRGRTRTRYHLPVLVEQDEDGVFIVSIPTLQGCRSYGYTLEEAMTNITEAAALCLEDETPATGTTFVGVRDLEIVA